jgi:hypothetical protein
MGASIYLGKVLSAGTKGCNIIVPTTTPFTGLLDTYPNAAAAYSLRKLRSAYSGNAIRVRRSSDNAELNIGFVNNVLDTASLLTFVGSGDGFLSYWYDQSGNSRHLEQGSTGNQPRIVLTGSIETSNSKPAVFVTSSRWMDFTTGAGNQTIPSSFFTVLAPVNNSSTSYFGLSTTIGGNEYMAVGNRGASQTISALYNDGGDPVVPIDGLSTSNNTMYLATNLNISETTTGRKLYVNSTNEYTSTDARFEQFYAGLRLNRMNQFNTGMGVAKWTEMIHYKTSQTSSRSGIETNMNNFYSIY